MIHSLSRRHKAGFTLAELVMVAALIALLATIVLPVAKFTVKRRKEAKLHLALRQMRTGARLQAPLRPGHDPECESGNRRATRRAGPWSRVCQLRRSGAPSASFFAAFPSTP